ncbi:MAG TPA: tRNA (adenosine(37)-N6)-threonylcarbamoyltransferase complex ATPase subunit type 1 TsaE [Actinomycetota bacterium]
MDLELSAPTPGDTRAIGEALASLLRAGDAVALTGELGAGKTTLVQGAARALGFEGRVVSPTFTLVREYQGRELRAFHVDVYRLERVQDVLDLGLDEMLAEGGVLFVEWGDAVEGILPEAHLVVELTVPGEGEERRIRVSGVGPSWAARWERLGLAVQRWSRAA